ncbi:barstar family protein [Kitasatospora sp. NPDC088391]|uniref:barstar family protein n=1 Tax=Kitasatospora sp. NPDC088391 TaxID=3364074 RepID=UPI0037F6E7DB
MRIEEAGHWERPFPVRYLIVAEGDGDDAPVLLGRCAAVEGLFTDPAPPPREVLVLRGCPPGATAGWLGTAWIVGRTASGYEAWWDLVDAEILSVAPSTDDPALVDVAVGGGVRSDDWHRDVDGPFLRFELTLGHGSPVAVGTSVPGLAADRDDPPDLPVRLIGCEPAEPMRAALRKRRGKHPGYTGLWTLDDTGRVMDRRAIGFDVEWTRPSVLGGALVDVLLLTDAELLPGAAARPVWRQRRSGRPGRPGDWRGLTEPAKKAWLSLAPQNTRSSEPDRSGGEYHLAGAAVEDLTGLHCALGEALLGPGGYYGWGLDALADCLGGGFGVVPPFTLVWHDFAATERELAGYPEEVARMLEERGVLVRRA